MDTFPPYAYPPLSLTSNSPFAIGLPLAAHEHVHETEMPLSFGSSMSMMATTDMGMNIGPNIGFGVNSDWLGCDRPTDEISEWSRLRFVNDPAVPTPGFGLDTPDVEYETTLGSGKQVFVCLRKPGTRDTFDSYTSPTTSTSSSPSSSSTSPFGHSFSSLSLSYPLDSASFASLAPISPISPIQIHESHKKNTRRVRISLRHLPVGVLDATTTGSEWEVVEIQ